MRTTVIDFVETIDDTPNNDLAFVPATACDGQMTFKNIGTTTLYIRTGQGKGAGKNEVSVTKASIILLAGESFTDDGLVAGWVIAVSSAAGGSLLGYITYR